MKKLYLATILCSLHLLSASNYFANCSGYELAREESQESQQFKQLLDDEDTTQIAFLIPANKNVHYTGLGLQTQKLGNQYCILT